MNAKEEFIRHTKERPNIKCASIKSYEDENPRAILKLNYSPEDFQNFLELLDFNYDSGYGMQELYGVILYDDETYSERHEYDGSESWSYKKAPEIPKECI